jgi:FkbM family methyltransferase
MNFWQQRLLYLRSLGFSPKVIYDIGACKAGWTEKTEKVFPDSNFYLFEANPNQKPFLEKGKHPFFIELLGDEEKPTTFYWSKIHDGGGDSILRENSSLYSDKYCNSSILQMKTLSSVVKKNKLPNPNLIKMDVQGSEKLVIIGGLDIVFSAEVVILEVQLIQYNKGAALFLELSNLMDKLDFQIVDILDIMYLSDGIRKTAISNIDVMFIKKNSKFKPTGILF